MQRFKWTVIPALVLVSWLSAGAYTLSALESLYAPRMDPMPVFVEPPMNIEASATHS